MADQPLFTTDDPYAQAPGSAGALGAPARQSRLVVIGVDRSKQLQRAKRHTFLVKSLRVLLPVATVGSLGMYVALALSSAQWTPEGAIGAIAKILPENLAMKNPNYQGFTGDGGAYSVRAERARQDLTNPGVIDLESITGELTDASKRQTDLKAARGTFTTKTSMLTLAGGIDIASADGMKARLMTALVDTKGRKITSKDKVQVSTAQADILSEEVEIDQNTRTVRFASDVRTVLRPSNPAGEDKVAEPVTTTAGLIGGNDAPTNILSNELEIRREAGYAAFRGQVQAEQAGQSLQTELLEVAFEAGETEGKAAASSSDAGRVKAITAPGPVVLTRATGEKVTGQSARFDIEGDKAVVMGNVVMTAAAGQQALADVAEFQPKADRILLTGKVIVSQGENLLRGTRLLVDRTSGTSRLTAPGGNPARIFARLIRREADGGATATAEQVTKKASSKGAFSATTFRSNPNAPTEIVADALDVDDARKQAVFTGTVQVEQDKIALRANRIVANYSGRSALLADDQGAPDQGDGTRLTRIRATGEVFISSRVDGQTASGDWAEFDLAANTVNLGGDVVLSQGKNVIRATALAIDLQTGDAVIESAPGAAGEGWASTLESSAGDKKTVAPVRTELRGGRPSAVFYPSQLGDRSKVKGAKKAPDAARPSASSWETNTNSRP